MANLRRNDKDYKYPESNALIGAKYGATLLENKILAIAFSELDRAQFAPDGTIVVSFKAAELRKLLGDENNNLYNSLKKVSEKMIGRVFGITNDENHEFHYAALVTNADYVNGVFTITFNSKLRNYLVNLKDRYTLLSLSEMLSFKSVYAFRIYEILRSHAFEKNHYAQRRTDGGYEISAGLSELKFQLGIINAQEPEVQRILQKTVPPDYDAAMEAAKVQKYKSYTQFRRGILDPAIAEINEKTGMNLSYNTLRSGLGGKVVSVEFVISGTDMKTLQTADAVLDASVIESSSAAEVSVTSKGFSSAASSTGTRKRSRSPLLMRKAFLPLPGRICPRLNMPTIWLVRAGRKSIILCPGLSAPLKMNIKRPLLPEKLHPRALPSIKSRHTIMTGMIWNANY